MKIWENALSISAIWTIHQQFIGFGLGTYIVFLCKSL